MSVLIKGMKMPECCLECPFEDSPEFDSYCIAIGNEFIGEWEGLGMYKPDWCPLEEPKTGEWIKAKGMMPPEFHGHHCCSECGAFANMDAPYGNREGLSNYCPNCGSYNGGERK